MEPSAVEPLAGIPDGWLDPGAPPLVLDVGCHRGAFLTALAEISPSENILGIEKLPERVRRTCRKIERLALPNAWAIVGEGRETLAGFPTSCVQTIHILFPDPWPKRRHAPRRMVNSAFLSECVRILKPDGLLRFVTDDEPYAKETARAAEPAANLHPCDLAENAFPPSSFELTFTGLSKPIHRLSWQVKK